MICGILLIFGLSNSQIINLDNNNIPSIDNLVSAVDEIKAQLNETLILAPADQISHTVNFMPGEDIKVGEQVMNIANVVKTD
jgi:multidrug resistance efflux pump